MKYKFIHGQNKTLNFYSIRNKRNNGYIEKLDCLKMHPVGNNKFQTKTSQLHFNVTLSISQYH